MFCQNCGASIAEGVKFCPDCGARQDLAAASAPAQNRCPSAVNCWRRTLFSVTTVESG